MVNIPLEISAVMSLNFAGALPGLSSINLGQLEQGKGAKTSSSCRTLLGCRSSMLQPKVWGGESLLKVNCSVLKSFIWHRNQYSCKTTMFCVTVHAVCCQETFRTKSFLGCPSKQGMILNSTAILTILSFKVLYTTCRNGKSGWIAPRLECGSGLQNSSENMKSPCESPNPPREWWARVIQYVYTIRNYKSKKSRQCPYPYPAITKQKKNSGRGPRPLRNGSSDLPETSGSAPG